MGTQRATRRGGWKQWTPEQAKPVVAAWRASGVPLATYARSQGVSARRLSWWRDQLGEWTGPSAPAGSSDARLVPAIISAPKVMAVISAPRVTEGAVVTVRLARDVRLEIADVAAVSTNWVAELAMRLSRDL